MYYRKNFLIQKYIKEITSEIIKINRSMYLYFKNYDHTLCAPSECFFLYFTFYHKFIFMYHFKRHLNNINHSHIVEHLDLIQRPWPRVLVDDRHLSQVDCVHSLPPARCHILFKYWLEQLLWALPKLRHSGPKLKL